MTQLPSASEARKVSEQNTEKIKRAQVRNARLKAMKERKEDAERLHERYLYEKKIYEEGIAKSISSGGKSFKRHVASESEKLSVKEMLANDDDGPGLKKIWRSLRAKGYRITITMKKEYHDGLSYCDEIADSEPWTSYEYTATVSW